MKKAKKPAPRRRGVSRANLTAQQRNRLDRHVKRVKKADAGIVSATWKLADELAALVEVFKDCLGRKPRAKELARLVELDRNPDRMLLLAKLASFFSPDQRHDGLGVRVFEAAYKRNKALKRQGRKLYTANELADIIKDSRSAVAAAYDVSLAADLRDGPEEREEMVQLFDDLKAGASDVRLTAKKWLRMFETTPYLAVAAGIKLLPNESDFERVNELLKKMHVGYMLIADETDSSPRPADILDDAIAADAKAA